MVATRQALAALDRKSRHYFPVSIEGCVLYLPLWQEDMQGSPILSYDKSHFAGTVTGATWGSQGRTFDGSDDLIAFAGFQAQLDGAAWTLVFWCKPDTVTVTSRYLATTCNDNQLGGFLVRQRVAGGFDCLVRTNDTNSLDSGRIGSDNVLDCYAFVYDNSQALANKLRGYLNGVDSAGDSSQTGTFTGMTNAPQPLKFGNFGNEVAGGFADGLVGEFWAYKRALTQPEIQRIYQVTKWRYV